MREFVLHNGKGVLFGRYSTEEFSKKYMKIFKENEKMKECLKSYGYPKHEDGDRAYIFGFEARKCLEELK